jgi:hypothetical protein
VKRITILAAAIALSASILGRPAPAHHSFAMFDSKNQIAIEGVVKEFAWKNPHAMLWIVVAAKGGKPEQLWSVEMTSPGNLTRAGWTKRSFNPGDKVKLDIRPLLSGETGGAFVKATFSDTGKTLEIGSHSEYLSKPDIK